MLGNVLAKGGRTRGLWEERARLTCGGAIDVVHRGEVVVLGQSSRDVETAELREAVRYM